jgi:glycosyltransferase involved in cell wall biosynthesis
MRRSGIEVVTVKDTGKPGNNGHTDRQSIAGHHAVAMQHDAYRDNASTPATIVFICINYNCGELILELHHSIASQKDQASRLLIVNNSPDDRSLSQFTSKADVTVLEAGRNLGFGGGCNLALDYLQQNEPQAISWLINPDASLLPGAIKTIRACLSSTRGAMIIGTRIFDRHRNIWFDHGRFNKQWGKINHEPIEPDQGAGGKAGGLLQQCDWVSGCSLIINQASFEELPRFDEQIFLYYEDAELCLRLGRKGVKSYVTRDPLVAHSVSATTSKDPIGKLRHSTFGKLYLLHQHGTPWSVAINLMRYCIRAAAYWPVDCDEAAGRALGVLSYLRWLSMLHRPGRRGQRKGR